MIVAAETAGTFVLTVSARRWPIASGSYTLRLTGVRPSTASDRELLRAMRLRAEMGRAEDAGNLELATARAAEALAVAERGASLSRQRSGAVHLRPRAALLATGPIVRKPGRCSSGACRCSNDRSVPTIPGRRSRCVELGVVLTTDGDFVRADAVLHRALEIQEKALGPDDPDLGLTLRDLGSLLERRGDLTKAEEMDLRALAILEKAEGRARLLAGSVLNNLGVIYLSRRDYKRAGEYLERGLPLMEACVRR